jgi:hypothetical protein
MKLFHNNYPPTLHRIKNLKTAINMKKTVLILLTMLGLSFYNVNAQDKAEFKPSGKPEALIFTDFNNISTGGKSQNKFEITRAYIGYGYNFSPEWSGRAVLDFGNQGISGYQYTAFLKYGYMQYAPKNLTVKFGLIQAKSFELYEKLYGNRYIMKVLEDQYGMNSSADFGVSAEYKFSDIISADVMLQNGEGYKINDADSVLKVGVGVTLHPVKELTIRGYYDNMAKNSATQQTVDLLAVYTNKTINLGVGYDYQTDNKLKKGQDWSGVSAFGNYYFSPKVDLFARYDNLSSVKVGSATTPWNNAKDGQLVMFGVEFIPVKGIRIAPNYQLWTPRDNTKSNISTVVVNVEIKM